MATVASGAQSELSHVREVTTGTIPATPVFTSVPFVSSSLDLTRGTLEDASIQSNRQRPASRLGNISAAGSISTVLRAGTYDWLLENLMLNSWASDVLKIGQTRISDSIQLGYKNLATPLYRVFKGCVVNQAVFTVPTTGVATAQFDLLGTDTTIYGGITGTVSPAAASEGMTHLLGTFSEGAISPHLHPSSGVFTSISMTVTNNYQQTYVLGTTAVHDVVPGDLKISGQLVAYFEDAVLANKFITEETADLTWKLIDTAGNWLQFVLPHVRYTGAQAPIQNSGPISLTLPFEASYDGTSDTTLTITRHLVS